MKDAITLILILLSMQRSNSQILGQFALPSGMATNSQELRTLQRKLLQKHNQPHINTSPRSHQITQHNQQQRQKQNNIYQYDDHRKNIQKQQKSSLSQDLIQQMRQKSQLNQQSKQQNINHEHHLTRYVDNLDMLEKQQQKRFNKKYASQAQEDMKLKRGNHMREVRKDQEEKEFYRNRYSVSDLGQSYKQMNSSNTNPTKNYYHQLDRALNDRETKLVNPEHIANSSFKITRRADNLSGLDFMFQGAEQRSSYIQQNSYFNEMKNRESKEKMDLKSTLIAQIKEKEATRKMEKSNDFFNPYTSQDYKGKHHPINNPVDYRFGHDNKYVMRDLCTQK